MKSPFILFIVVLLILPETGKTQSGFPYSVDLFGENYSPEKLKQVNDAYHQQMLSQNPKWDIEREEFEKQVQNYLAFNKTSTASSTMVTIPVVVHIVYEQPIQNISDAQVYSQIVVLNEDFSRTAADTSATPPPFKAIAGNPNIQFCLAKRTPLGSPTTGIERRSTTITEFGFDNKVKFFAEGGLDAWDPTKYLNIWVCNTGGVSWAEFPNGTVSNTYGIVMHYIYMGSNFTSYGFFPGINGYYNRGELCVHEVGHALNVRHIWGDDGTSCLGSDTCADTPNQQGPNSYCPNFPLYDSCTTSGDGLMFQNFMDYVDDDCYNLFSLGQVARMQAVLSIPPYNGLTTSNGCMPFNVGVEEIGSNMRNDLMRVFPNPSNGKVYLQVGSGGELQVFNSVGKLIWRKKLDPGGEWLDMGAEAEGIYFCRFSSSEGFQKLKLVIAR